MFWGPTAVLDQTSKMDKKITTKYNTNATGSKYSRQKHVAARGAADVNKETIIDTNIENQSTKVI